MKNISNEYSLSEYKQYPLSTEEVMQLPSVSFKVTDSVLQIGHRLKYIVHTTHDDDEDWSRITKKGTEI